MTKDEGAIQDILKQLQNAWNAYDSVSFADAFVEDANFIQIFGRAQVNFHEGTEAREIETRPTLIVARQGAEWKIVAFQNTKISAVPVAAQAAARLAT